MNKTVLFIWLSQVTSMDCAAKLFLLTLYGGIEELYKASPADLKQSFETYDELRSYGMRIAYEQLCDKDLGKAEKSAEKAEAFGAEVISFDSIDYPELLRSISNPPMVLYCRGRRELLKEPGVAMVGTRKASPYGKWAASELAHRIAASGRTVVSGMAEGIDSFSHRGVLDRNGNTIAVLGCAVDVCFPVSGRKLYEEILEKGLIVSEYSMGDTAHSRYFPERNRIISGLSDKVIVVEGAYKSGSMITARLALDQGRDVYAVPGNINQPNSFGTNYLISDGACPIMDIDIALETLGLAGENKRRVLSGLSDSERQVFDLIQKRGGASPEEIAMELQLDFSMAAVICTALEIKKVVRRNGNYLLAT